MHYVYRLVPVPYQYRDELGTSVQIALREFFRAKVGSCACSDFSSGESTREIGLPQSEREHMKLEQPAEEISKSENSADETQRSPAKNAKAGGSFLQLNDAADEFFDVINELEHNEAEALWPSDDGLQTQVCASCENFQS
ncbi:hypothetical protein BHE74_00039378 [Ensete ventricosum]|nr:hypothetical protein BHE74_00039378 [Ensete ventricosum]RZR89509.1 hypothetical protein BHM03_00017240 [Ensete ventricosum]